MICGVALALMGCAEAQVVGAATGRRWPMHVPPREESTAQEYASEDACPMSEKYVSGWACAISRLCFYVRDDGVQVSGNIRKLGQGFARNLAEDAAKSAVIVECKSRKGGKFGGSEWTDLACGRVDIPIACASEDAGDD